MDYNKLALEMHEQNKGKIAVRSKVTVKTRDDLSTAYTPGVAEPCRKIRDNKEEVYRYTAKGNLVAVVSDGTAVLGLGDIGPEAAMPVMEGKALLFKEFADIDAFPICLDTKDTEEIIKTVKNIAPCFGGINLEDISAPRCFEIEKRLKEELDIPVFHDDQHGTAIAALAAVLGALRLIKKGIGEAKVVMFGAGAAGTAIARLLLEDGVKPENMTVLNSKGILYDDGRLNRVQKELAKQVNPENRQGTFADAVKGADILLATSAPAAFKEMHKEAIKTMAEKNVVFAMANPIPEMMLSDAQELGVYVFGTGRSDMPNQVNNSSVFPGLFRGALDVRARQINEPMKLAAAHALADLVSDEELKPEYVVVDVFDPRVPHAVAKASAKAAIESGVARVTELPEQYKD